MCNPLGGLEKVEPYSYYYGYYDKTQESFLHVATRSSFPCRLPDKPVLGI